jgi:hypothetical protein
MQVINLYNYTSLPEFNAVLKQFGVVADRGKEGSFTHRKNGLLYRMLNRDGQPVGVPIKASTIAGKPTLKSLEQKFAANKKNREVLKISLQQTLVRAMRAQPKNLDDLIAHLSKKDIYTVLRQNAEGRIYGITFVDNNHRSVFNGSELGRAFSIAGIQGALHKAQEQHPAQQLPQHCVDLALLDNLLQPVDQSMQDTPLALRKKKKKKKRPGQTN